MTDDPLAWLEHHLEQYKTVEDPHDRSYHVKKILAYAQALNDAPDLWRDPETGEWVYRNEVLSADEAEAMGLDSTLRDW